MKRILLVISGGIAAYKVLELIRRGRERGYSFRTILTKGGEQFVTPLSVSSLTEEKVYSELWSLTDEAEMGHIRLSREADLIVVAPASANLLAKMANGMADDLASTALLAADKPILIAPAMNHRMWSNPATQENLAKLAARGVHRVGPTDGAMACNEFGTGRMAEPEAILAAIEQLSGASNKLAGKRALVTSGPTYEALDPVRFLGNRSSGKQGHAIARALSLLGADTVLVTGPTHEPDPVGVKIVRVESAAEMLTACQASLPVDVAVFAAAVADWTPAQVATAKRKKNGGAPPSIELVETTDILATVSKAGNTRPRLVVGFAAETENLVANAQAKLARKGCDWIVANLVGGNTGTFGGDSNEVALVTARDVETWTRATKDMVATQLAARIADTLSK
ncbi:bifunctional phosphopantothenoylcysteine decarboxylase/phosphopantothenate--cysteine ligase CoaBC [Roseiterribacter gracilis]|uniref:Coenzyme A biosynthesis bifunctional protein CoaBC n=1 Tax=Roseiterribacter gracilis TaxID=2812848 RepID=A0A8S8XAZ0_9PROT|nr:phosphopantothenate synthase [Rhodospirillales bacterium TMPK1]